MASPRLDCSGESLFCCEDICASPSDDGEQGSTNNPIFGCSDSSSGIPITVTEMQEPHSQDAVSALIKREISHSPSPDYLEKYETKLLDEESRHKAVSWFFKARAFFRFSPLTVVLSVNYLDRFLSRHEVPMRKSWMIDLVSVACLSLAAKMEEVEVPLLVDLQVAPDYFFEPCTVLRMELLLLSTLEWRADSVTPFSYIEYFICKCRLSGPIYQNLASQITELILLAVKDLNFLRHHYCSIAAAAILCAIKEMLPSLLEEHKKNIFSMFPSCLQPDYS
ncbi:hypothetical protein KP509_22G064100 [Ceratopteris richardii]|uniref:Cyclin-like domain-containing protein n=1 Tax=Ceratopteris richardii TaxID=49495 RepID=A0A8T2S5X0_CERRI|nr:hypothetical protein KP509_22G064100 [Ceratopteris richardii]